MRIKSIIDENFQDYKKTSMLIATCFCDWKCMKEQKADIGICQNSKLMSLPNCFISEEELYTRYIKNPFTEAIIFGGLEPFLQFEEVCRTIAYFREKGCLDDIVIYTGYTFEEVAEKVQKLKEFQNITIKYGRFLLKSEPIFDEVLGIKLASRNQYAEKIS